jgi:hypothetical protein
LWLENTSDKLKQIELAIEKVFPDAPIEFHDHGPTKVFQVRFPDTHRVMNVVFYEKDHFNAVNNPNGVQIGYFLEKEGKKGKVSPKDPATRRDLMKWSLNFMRGLKQLITELKSLGFNPWYYPIDESRDKFFAKLFG